MSYWIIKISIQFLYNVKNKILENIMGSKNGKIIKNEKIEFKNVIYKIL